MIGSIIGMLFGVFVLIVLLTHFVTLLRRRSRSVRVPGVFVATRDARGELGQSPSVHKRAAYFRFTTLDGRVVQAESRVQSFPGPKPGKRVMVMYDPARPYKAETTGRFAATLGLFLPLGIALGLLVLIMNLLDFLAAS